MGDRGEAEGGGGGGSGNRSDLERPLLLVTSCSEDGLETQAEDTDPPANVAANADAPGWISTSTTWKRWTDFFVVPRCVPLRRRRQPRSRVTATR